jgi:polyribonucleotide nucleotidyltransferase
MASSQEFGDPIRVTSPINAAGKTMTLETGRLAPQANGAVLVQVGNTTLLSTVVTTKPREGIDFFPLTVDVEERMYAAGKIPGAVFRREGRPSEPAVLTARLTDRPLRPSFPEGFRNEVQVIATVFGADLENPHDIPSIIGASAALMVSGIPFDGPIGAVRLSRHGSEWITHPTFEESSESTFELIVAGRRVESGDIAIMMVEAGGTEATWRLYEEGAPKVTEEVIAEGIEEAKVGIGLAIDLQKELVAAVVRKHGPIEPIAYDVQTDYGDDVFEAVAAEATPNTADAMAIADKTERNSRLDQIEEGLLLALCGTPEMPEPFFHEAVQVRRAFRALQKKVVRSRIVNEGLRIDGRGTTDLRPLSSDVGLVPTSHGSGLFQRGETQVLSVLTLGMPRMEQTIGLDELRGTTKRYIHHYNFPPFSTGETGRVGAPRRREIGHGALAERALLPVVPSKEEWPYTLRVVSEVLSSNGSTSMASVCGSTLSLMDGGVPIKAPVAGIAMGLVYAEGKYTTLTDILGAEDAFGDMDFKVAGTRDFVTALQLDTKIDGLPADVLAEALTQARDARMKILGVMAEAIDEPRAELRETAPKIVSFEIPMDKIGEVIGPKGKVINTITQETGADVSVSDDGAVGLVTIGSTNGEHVEEARRRIELILDPPTAELGAEYTGRVVNVTKFGAFVNVLPGRDGLLHISKLGRGKRVERVEDVLNLGDEVTVRVDDIDNQGKLSLSFADDTSGDDRGGEGGGGADRAPRESREPRESRGPRDRDGGRGDRNDRPNGETSRAAASADVASFDEFWDSQAKEEFGDLGPAEVSRSGGARPGGGSGGGRPGGDRGGQRRRRTR